MNIRTEHPAVTHAALAMRNHTQTQIAAALNDRAARAFLQQGDAQACGLDFNARLITELRAYGIWPNRNHKPPP